MFARGRTLAGAGAGLLTWAVAVASAEPSPTPPAPPKAEAPAVRTVSGPFTHGNLSVFLLHGSDVMPGKTILTLQEALAQKKAVVHETSNVNQLSVENTSDDATVFIQSGDIVKGGKQDRAIAFDMLLPPKSGLVNIGSFCCEAGRWRQRGGESAVMFGESNAQIVGKDLKQAVIGNDSSKQREVWDKVGEAQAKLSKNAGAAVNDPASPSSLQLALENKKVQEKLTGYESALAKAIEGKNDVIGVALCVNGKVEGAEVYGSADLFRKLWPKVLKSAATDALAEADEKKPFEPATAKAVETFLADAAAGPAKEVPMTQQIRGTQQRGQVANGIPQQELAGQPAQQPAEPAQRRAGTEATTAVTAPQAATPARVRMVRYDGSKVLLIESQDKDAPTPCVLHRCYIAKDEPKKAEPKK